MPTVIDLANLGSGGFVIQGDTAGDRAGFSVSSAGDVNGDGFDDVIVGAWAGDDGGSVAGEAYVIFGKAAGFGTIDLTNLGTAGFIIQGDHAGDLAGRSVSSAGDVNGDGFDDLIVGAPYGDDGGTNAGEAYVVFGKAGGFGTVDLTSLGTAGFIIQGGGDFDLAGDSVSSAGDVNGDGFDDLIVGAAAGGATDAGESYVIFGKAGGFGTVDLANLGTAGFVISGGTDVYSAGIVSSAGDVNGDGFDDLIIGAPSEFGAGNSHFGEAYVVFGKAGGFASVDLSNLGTEGFVIQGDTAGNVVGTSVSSAGDINGDGFDDLIIGSPMNEHGGLSPGQAYVIFGKATGFGTIDLTNLGAAGFIIHGSGNEEAGYSASSAGDVNGDGFDDLIVGAPEHGAGAGAAYVIFGKANGFGSVDLVNLASADGFVIHTGGGFSLTGRSVSGSGDVNGDGFDDVILGAPYGSAGGQYSGQAYVVFGMAPTESVTRIGSEIGQTIRGGAFDDTLDGRGGDDQLFGGAGNDGLIGGGGNDILDGGDGADAMTGGDGNDVYIIDHAGDIVIENAGEGIDLIYTSIGYMLGANVERLGVNGFTTTYDINLTGNGLDNEIWGNDGRNVLDGGAGADILHGNGGDDIYIVDNAGDVVVDSSGFDLVYTSVSYTLDSTVERLGVNGFTTTYDINLTGNGIDNELWGNDGRNILNGGAGADILRGFGGDDIYFVDNAGDLVLETTGFDTIYTSVSYALGANVERLGVNGFTTSYDINLTGNGLDNEIWGNDGRNVLDGGAGADILHGNGGDDIYIIDNVGDVVLDSAGFDTIYTSINYTLVGPIERLGVNGFTTTYTINLSGNGLDNEIWGNDGVNLLDGGVGADIMHGNGGDDIYIVDNVGDVAVDSAGLDTIYTSVSYTLNSTLERLGVNGFTTTYAINLTGNELANELWGNDGVNILDGRLGADILRGNGGADTFAFTTALGGGNIDQVVGYQAGVDKIALDDAIFSGLATGALSPAAFRIGTGAQDADDRIIYDSTTGALYYDADGNGAGVAVQFAALSDHLAITAGDFTVI